jgi:hypothetical protein
MNKLLRLVLALLATLATQGAQAGQVSDVGATAYWGADAHGYGDVIGNSTYDISGATITRAGNVLTVTIATNFAGNAGSDPSQAPQGIGYGDLFLAQTWNPFGSDAHHTSDNAANGTDWAYGLSLDNRWSNTGGTFKVYKLKGTNATDILNAETFMSCTIGTQCYYRNGQAAAVNTLSSSVERQQSLNGTWSVNSTTKELKFQLDMTGSDLINFSSFAMHWGETCQNDVVEGMVKLPEPGGIPLVMLGLGAIVALRRRKGRQN